VSRLALRVEAPRCTRCGACAALCPGVFDVSGSASRVARQPIAAEEHLAEAARWICPTDAIRQDATEREGVAMDPDVPRVDVPVDGDGALFDELATGAERVRWPLDALPWQELDAALAPPELRAIVREMAFSENATYSATQRFLETFYDDVDFSRWVAVWFYEETRHPYVLLEWLRRAGERLSPDFILKGRVSTPFMRSLVGTLVTNVISEVTAARAYRRLGRSSPEPVLGRLAALIAGDEARHAASFFRFARRRLAAESPEGALRDRARGLEVLQAWLGGARPATHPVAQMVERLGGFDDGGSYDLGLGEVRTRVVRIVGLLLDVPVRRAEDVAPALRDLLGRTRT
jgi:ferredoxin